jgi:hypothetical protein
MVLVYHTYGILSTGKLKKVSKIFYPKGRNGTKIVSLRPPAKRPPFRWERFQGRLSKPLGSRLGFDQVAGKRWRSRGAAQEKIFCVFMLRNS